MILFIFIFVGASLFYFISGRLISFKNQILTIDYGKQNLSENPEEADTKNMKIIKSKKMKVIIIMII